MIEKKYILSIIAFAAAVFCIGAASMADPPNADDTDCLGNCTEIPAFQFSTENHTPVSAGGDALTGTSEINVTVTFFTSMGKLQGDVTATATVGKEFLFDQTVLLFGNEFIGWNTAEDGSGIWIASGDVWTLDSDTALYAQWRYSDTGGWIKLQTEDDMFITGFRFMGWYGNEDFTGERIYYLKVTDIDVIKLYAKWAKIYNVTFDANGGRLSKGATAEALSGEIFEFGQYAKRTGYTFTGWNTEPDGRGTQIVSGELWAMGSDITLYAQWVNGRYTISFEDGGCTWTKAKPTGYTYDDYIKLPDESYMSKEGYKFLGWYEESDFGGDRIYAIERTDAGNKTFYAWWGKICNVKFDLGGHGTVDGDVSATAVQGMTFFPPIVIPDEGFALEGWYTDDGTLVNYGDTWKFSSDIVLYAKWSKCYTVTFDGNGGALQGAAAATAYAEKAFIFDQYAVLFGNDFTGWNTKADGNGQWVVSGDVWTIESDVTLYAQWAQWDDDPGAEQLSDMYSFIPKPDRKYTVTFDDSIGMFYGKTTATACFGKAFVFDQYVMLCGNNFIGWNTDPCGNGKWIVSGDVWTIESDVTLYAQWEHWTTYTVTFDGNGGKLVGEPAATAFLFRMFVFDQYAVLFGNDFIGWNTEADGSGEWIVSGDRWTIKSDATLYAQWEHWETCTVTFDGNGGILVGEPAATAFLFRMFVFDQYAVLFGNCFVGWNTEADGSGEWIVSGDRWTIGSDVTLYAQWEHWETCTVTFDGNGGKLVGEPAATAFPYRTFVFDQYAVLFGNGFVGWNTEADGSGEWIVSGDIWTIGSDVTLYAQWEHWDDGTDEEQPRCDVLTGPSCRA